MNALVGGWGSLTKKEQLSLHFHPENFRFGSIRGHIYEGCRAIQQNIHSRIALNNTPKILGVAFDRMMTFKSQTADINIKT